MTEPIAEVGYLAGLVGWDGTDPIKVQVNSDGRLEIVLPLEEALGARAYHYTGTDWVRSNLLWGYHDRWSENVENTDTGAGNIDMLSDAVPAGYVYVLQAVWGISASRQPTAVDIRVHDGSDYLTLAYETPAGANIPGLWSGEVPLKEGDKADIRIRGCQAGDAIYGGFWGYKMKINM